jgi:putative FmdB family regulatory protein
MLLQLQGLKKFVLFAAKRKNIRVKNKMPTYDYICKDCNNSFEHFQSITSSPLKKCPKCGKKKLIRLVGSGSAILFKGKGFYTTDYRSESYKKGEKNG